jgi:hypothetical protein
MSKISSREIHLASRPNGIPTETNFTLARTELEPLQDREVLVRNLFMSVDPYMRGRMNDEKSYVPPFELRKAASRRDLRLQRVARQARAAGIFFKRARKELSKTATKAAQRISACLRDSRQSRRMLQERPESSQI